MLDPYFHPIVSAWISENTFDVQKRAITAATYNVIVQVGSVISSRKPIPFAFPFLLFPYDYLSPIPHTDPFSI